MRQFGREGEGDGELSYPSGICIDSNDVVYVADMYNHCVSVFTHEGVFLISFGSKAKGTEQGQFHEPRGMAVDKNGTIYISDYENDRIQLFN